MNSGSTAVGTFEILRFAERDAAEQTADRLRTMLDPRLGFTWSDLFVDGEADGAAGAAQAALVHCAEWPARPPAAEQREQRELPELARRLAADAGAQPARTLGGTLAVSIDGPAAAAAPGVAVLAIRHVSGIDAARELGTLLLRSGEWKREVSGFIGASAYISADGREFINYVRWVDEAAYQRYMTDPRNAAGQPGIASTESAEPEFVKGQSVRHTGARLGSAVLMRVVARGSPSNGGRS